MGEANFLPTLAESHEVFSYFLLEPLARKLIEAENGQSSFS